MKTFDARIKLKEDTASNWLLHSDFIPMAGEIIIYSDFDTKTDAFGDTQNIPNIKIGDGVTSVFSLPFLSENLSRTIANLQDAIEHRVIGERFITDQEISDMITRVRTRGSN